MLQGLLARARALTEPGEGPLASRPADPLPSAIGPSPFARRGRAPTAPPPPASWVEDPETGARLPEGPRPVVDPGAFPAARVAHRHGWAAALAFAAGSGDTVARDALTGALTSWLRRDVPGTGLAWAHGSDLAARLVHWHAALAWAGAALPAPLRADLAGSARWHLDHLRARVPTQDRDGLRRIVHLCGMVVGGFTFPDLPDARAAWSEGLAGLRWHLPNELHPDGSPRDDAPGRFAEVLWYVAIARSVTRANGAAFPTAADAALTRATRYLERLAGELGSLPPVGEAPLGDLLPAAGHPLAWSLWNLVRAWGLDDGPPAPGTADDPRVAWLGGPVPLPAAAPESAGKTWGMWVYRESGLSIAHMRIKNQPSRVLAYMGAPGREGPLSHPAPLQVLWDVGAVEVLADPGPAEGAGPLGSWLRSADAHNVLILDGHSLAERVPAAAGVARVDGKKARIEGSHTGWHRLRVPLTHERDLLLNQARLVVTDRLVPVTRRPGRHAVRLSWQLGAGWELTPEGTGFIARQAGLTLVIQLPAALVWSVHTGESLPHPAGWLRRDRTLLPAPCLVGSGGVDGAVELVSSFEVR